MNRRALPRVQHPALQERVINRQAHFPAKGIQFANQMPLGRAADHRVTGHQRYAVHIQC